MSNRRRIERLVRMKLRSAGRQWGEARREFEAGRESADDPLVDLPDLPTDDEGRARIVCRRHAERRAVDLDGAGRPHCFDPDHQDCQGCVEDIRDDRIETW